MNPEIVTFPSRDGKTTIYAEKYVPEKEIRGILVVAHGMNEHFGRYKEFCEVLANEGFLVAGPDHLGHGHTARDYQKEFGYFTENDGATVLVRDLHRLKKLLQGQYPGKPVFLMGHSMGSFIARNYIEMYGTGIQGAVLMGTADFNSLTIRLGRMYLSLSALMHGWHAKDRFYTSMALGGFSRAFPEDGPDGWCCSRKDPGTRKQNDGLMGSEFTVNGYYCLSDLILRMQDRERMKEIPKELPLFFVSGEEDPVGDYGRGVRRAAGRYGEAGLNNVRVKLYPGDRHEICHENDRFNVFFDIMGFMEEAGGSGKGYKTGKR